MAKKKKKTSSLQKNPTFMTLGVIVILILGALGFQVPEVIQDYFGTNSPKTQQFEPEKKEPNQEDTSQKSTENPGPIDHGLPTFTAEELTNSSKGWIEYGEMDTLGRPSQANALIKKPMINTGTKANPNVRPPGFISGLDPHGHARGHLIGRQFGGSGDDPRNLVTLYQNPVNTPLMTKYENMIRQAVDNGETVRYRVTPVYNDKDLMPTEVHMEGQSLNKNGRIQFNVSILNQK